MCQINEINTKDATSAVYDRMPLEIVVVNSETAANKIHAKAKLRIKPYCVCVFLYILISGQNNSFRNKYFLQLSGGIPSIEDAYKVNCREHTKKNEC